VHFAAAAVRDLRQIGHADEARARGGHEGRDGDEEDDQRSH
jgi:hypothetical protein